MRNCEIIGNYKSKNMTAEFRGISSTVVWVAQAVLPLSNKIMLLVLKFKADFAFVIFDKL